MEWRPPDLPRHRVRELNLVVGASFLSVELCEDFGLQDVAADYAER